MAFLAWSIGGDACQGVEAEVACLSTSAEASWLKLIRTGSPLTLSGVELLNGMTWARQQLSK